MKLIIAGTRTFDDYELLSKEVDKFIKEKNITITEIVSGGAIGADKLGERYAKNNNITITSFPANWKEYGKAAGYLRNNEMAMYADYLIAFWDGKSSGTKHMIFLANENDQIVKTIRY